MFLQANFQLKLVEKKLPTFSILLQIKENSINENIRISFQFFNNQIIRIITKASMLSLLEHEDKVTIS